MKELKLSNSDKVALVDDEDFDRIANLGNWQENSGSVSCKYKGRTVHLHRVILDLYRSDYIEVDHKDRNWLNNQKLNLRKADRSDNGCNKPSPGNLTGFKGVWFCPKMKKFYARIKKNQIRYGLGSFDTAIEAAKAYNEAAIKLHGEFAYLNKI